MLLKIIKPQLNSNSFFLKMIDSDIIECETECGYEITGVVEEQFACFLDFLDVVHVQLGIRLLVLTEVQQSLHICEN